MPHHIISYFASHDFETVISLHWRHNGRDSISNHQPHACLLNRLFRRRSKKTSKLRVTGLYAGNSPGTGKFPAQMASYAEMFPFDDVIMLISLLSGSSHLCTWSIDLMDKLWMAMTLIWDGMVNSGSDHLHNLSLSIRLVDSCSGRLSSFR